MNSRQLIDLTIQDHDNKMLGICSKTGIRVSMNIPSTKGLYFDYTFPFANYSNVVAFAKLDYKNLASTYDSNVLAGCLITALLEHNILEDQLSSTHRNLTLADAPTYLLVDTIRFLVSLSEDAIAGQKKHKLLHLSLESNSLDPLKTQPIEATLKNWLNEARAITYPSLPSHATTATELDNASAYKIKVLGLKLNGGRNAVPNTTLKRENKIAFKELVKEAKLEGRLSSKLLNLLRNIGQYDHLATIDQETRTKIVIAIDKTTSELKVEFKVIIKHACYSPTIQEYVADIGATGEISAEATPLSKRLTIAELRIARKLKKEEANNDA